MTRRVLAFLAAVATALLALAVPAAGPAAAVAGDRVWSPTACYAEQPYNGAWLGTPGLGASYSSIFADYDVALQWITWNGHGQSYVQLLSQTHAYYAGAGYECGRFGLPYKTGVYSSPEVSYRWTFFVKPGSCDMRYIIDVFDTGPTFEGVAAGYFCQ
ncbi:MAG: hypothetical protein QOG43_3155 [Actinomycetota bacterium]|jgi:hypothetical protein|nr:hypothetical protein [Actinomycetota bacterium]